MKQLFFSILLFSCFAGAMEKAPTGIPLAMRQKVSPELAQRLVKKLEQLLADLHEEEDRISAEQINEVKELIAQGADLNFRGELGPLLFYAIGTHNTQIVRLFLDNGADINAQRGPETVLMSHLSSHMLKRPKAAIIKLLIEHGADVNAQSTCCKTALMMAAEKGLPDIVKILIEGSAPTITTQLQQLRKSEPEKLYLGALPQELMNPIAEYMAVNRADPNAQDCIGLKAIDFAANALGFILRLPKEMQNGQRIKEYEEVIDILKPLTTVK